jgi:hypothetical protein
MAEKANVQTDIFVTLFLISLFHLFNVCSGAQRRTTWHAIVEVKLLSPSGKQTININTKNLLSGLVDQKARLVVGHGCICSR